MIERRNPTLVRTVFVACALFLLLCGDAAAQHPLALPDAQPIATAPFGVAGAWITYADGSAALVELRDGALIVRQLISPSPQVLHATWTDRTGTAWTVDTSCANITIEECVRRHLDAVGKLQAAAPPV